MREAAEAGRRQKEERRRHEHDEMFKQILGVTHDTVDEYFREIAKASVERYAEASAVEHVEDRARELDARAQEELSSIEQHETIAELVQHFLLPEAHKQASRNRVSALQEKRLEAVREELFGLLDTMDIEEEVFCKKCQLPYENCQCQICPGEPQPVEKPEHRQDPRWKYTRIRPAPAPLEEKIPTYYYFRDTLNALVDNVVLKAKGHMEDACETRYSLKEKLHERLEVTLDVREIIDKMLNVATGALILPVKKSDYHYTMKREHRDVLDRVETKKTCEFSCQAPKELPWKTEDGARRKTCLCEDMCVCEKLAEKRALQEMKTTKKKLTEEQLQELERIRQCKCDTGIAVLDEYAEGASGMELEKEAGAGAVGRPTPRTRYTFMTGRGRAKWITGRPCGTLWRNIYASPVLSLIYDFYKLPAPETREKTIEQGCQCKGVCKCESKKRKDKPKRDTKKIDEKVELPKEKKEKKCIDEEELAAKPCVCEMMCRCDAKHEHKSRKGNHRRHLFYIYPLQDIILFFGEIVYVACAHLYFRLGSLFLKYTKVRSSLNEASALAKLYDSPTPNSRLPDSATLNPQLHRANKRFYNDQQTRLLSLTKSKCKLPTSVLESYLPAADLPISSSPYPSVENDWHAR
ncbi:hypothetical protein EVAR_40758_1 [Eumeta japonica]|uniref:Uncharacterized protein n=1 Tax=Eumeta variegata TaxID=151549 RepID=A0A4C1X5V4_EUMVA|nr:hypothetical protein EVAR_40758_1 [Eumeta japonica]